MNSNTASPVGATGAPTTRVLVVGYVWPEPRSSAAGGHMMQLLECLVGQGWQVTFSSPAAAGEHRADLASLGIDEQAIELNSDSFDEFAVRLAPDIVLFDRFMMEEQFGWRIARSCPHALRVLETSDLQSLRDARRRLLQVQLSGAPQQQDFSALFETPQRALFHAMAGADLTLREIAAIYRSDISLMISDFEIALLTECFQVPPALLQYCPLAAEAPSRPVRDYRQRDHFVSIGNFRHAPNWDAVRWMKSAIWPLIRQQLPEARLHIYGAYTPPKATALHDPRQGFCVLDWAEDALQVMESARVCLAPLRFGAGIKGKLVDAMVGGTPSVTTPLGVEGMTGGRPWPGLVAGSAAGIADAAVRLYRDPVLWQECQLRGRALLAARYQRREIDAALIARLEVCRNQLDRHRADNFTGALLRHHRHYSSRYMSQWIEAKSRLRDVMMQRSVPEPLSGAETQ